MPSCSPFYLIISLGTCPGLRGRMDKYQIETSQLLAQIVYSIRYQGALSDVDSRCEPNFSIDIYTCCLRLV